MMESDGNWAFYEGMKLESFMNFAKLTGFDTGIDVDILYPMVKDAALLVELGAGYGRAIDFLLQKGFKGEIVAVDRIPHLVALLEERFHGRVQCLCQNIVQLSLPQPADAIVWLWSGILELTVADQARSVRQLYKNLKPGGLLILESPHKEIKIVGKHATNRHIQLRTEWGELNAFLPTPEEIEAYSKQVGFSSFEMKFYTSATGLARVFYIMRK
jgi:SAM-dependent methyltransferase